MAPEIYRNEPFDKSVDAFCFGLILYEVRSPNKVLLNLKHDFFVLLSLLPFFSFNYSMPFDIPMYLVMKDSFE